VPPLRRCSTASASPPRPNRSAGAVGGARRSAGVTAAQFAELVKRVDELERLVATGAATADVDDDVIPF
jgi:hypothetical protein